MAWWVLIGTLAAFGAVCVLWVLFGFLLPGRGSLICICTEKDVPHLRRRCRWLRELGLIHSPVRILSDAQQIQEVLHEELEKLDAAGNGNPSGNHQCGGISEL